MYINIVTQCALNFIVEKKNITEMRIQKLLYFVDNKYIKISISFANKSLDQY